MPKDATLSFLQNLPEIKHGEQFWFSCHSAVPCFNACCSDLTMPLTPYDVLRLCQGLDMGSEEFIEEFALASHYEDTGFPVLYLRMEDSPSRLCPFVTEKGCAVYEHRSSACRTYPLGRATRPGGKNEDAELVEQYFLVREEHCKGFAERQDWTITSWIENQRIEAYNRMNDRYMRLIARYKTLAGKAILSNKHATMALLCLYQQDRFLELISATKMFSHIDLIGEYAQKGRDKSISGILALPEERLWFAFDWMELVLFGSCPNIAPTEHGQGAS